MNRQLAAVAALACLFYLPALDRYSLYDPWETHYGEVARRMLEDEDYVVPRWQNEVFRSKPVFTFWLMAASMKLHRVGEDGGWSGEFLASHRLEGSLRLPFALFGVGGIVCLWVMLARLVSRRAAWLAAIVTATMPWYYLIARQAITDMPPCALLAGAMALFALAVLDPASQDPAPSRRGAWAFLGVGTAGMAVQLGLFFHHVGGQKMLVLGRPHPAWPYLAVLAALWIAFVASSFVWRPSRRQVLLWWAYLFLALSILAKGLAVVAVAGPAFVLYLAVTGDWKLIREAEIPRGLAILVAVALPWHVAMYAMDGLPWWREYVSQHLVGRALHGVHGDRGSFLYYLEQMAPGLWPWGALLPAALARVLLAGRPQSNEDKVRALLAVWAMVGFLFFALIKTKFHHYLLPAVPAFGALVGLWLDDLWSWRFRLSAPVLALGLALLFLTTLEVATAQHSLVNLFVYRYDRPWPYGEPWKLSFARPLAVFGVLLGIALALGFARRLQAASVAAACAVAVSLAGYVMHVFIPAAAPHWGQRRLQEIYFAERTIHGVELRGTNDVAEPLWVRALVPQTMHVGDPISVRVQKRELAGRVTRLGRTDFDVSIPPEERTKLDGLPAPRGRPRQRILADRLLAWQLNWRGENLYSNGEIWDFEDEDGRTVFVDTDNRRFLDYLRNPARAGKGRKFFVITEKARVSGLRSILPGERAKATFQEEDDSSNKFGLVSFTLD